MSGKSTIQLRLRRWRDPLAAVILFLSVVLIVAAGYTYFAAPIRAPRLQPGYVVPRLPAGLSGAEELAVEQFRSALKSSDENTVIRAAALLKHLPVPQLEDELLALKESNEQAWVRVLPELYATGWKTAMDELHEYLDAPTMEMTTLALVQLERMPPLSCADVLEADLNIPHDSMIVTGSKVLRAWRQATPEILNLLKTVVRGNRTVASQMYSAMALVVLGEDTKAAWARLRQIAASADKETSFILSRFLRQRPEKEATDILVEMLKRDETREWALAGLVGRDVADKERLLKPHRRVQYANDLFLVDINMAAAGEPEALLQDLERLRPGGGRLTVPLLDAMGEWHGIGALSFYENLAPEASRGERISISRNLRWYPWNGQARRLVRSFLARAEDEAEVQMELRTLGMIGRSSDIATLAQYLKATEPQTRLVAAWAILNVSRGLPITAASRLEV